MNKLLIVMSLVLTGCAAQAPLAPPQRSAFERCMDQTGKSFYYTSDRIRAADWCYTHNNGETKP